MVGSALQYMYACRYASSGHVISAQKDKSARQSILLHHSLKPFPSGAHLRSALQRLVNKFAKVRARSSCLFVLRHVVRVRIVMTALLSAAMSCISATTSLLSTLEHAARKLFDSWRAGDQRPEEHTAGQRRYGPDSNRSKALSPV